MIKKQVLGTAQLGLDYYGISNFSKKKIDKDLLLILHNAYSRGIKYYDTAPDYNSEKIIGKFVKKYDLKDKINIITKIPKLKKNQNPVNQITKSIENSLVNLNLSKIFCVLMHDQNDIKILKNKRNLIKLLKKKFNIKNFGFSVYDYSAAKKILHFFPDASIQFPYNLINNKFNKLKKKKNLFFARSIFCQGLLTSKNIKFTNPKINFAFKKYSAFIKSNKINPVQLCLDFVYSNKNLDFIIYGTKDVEELNQIIKYKKKKLDIKKIKKIKTFFKLKDTDPRSWKFK